MKLSRNTIKWISAILLLVCSVLPLSKCENTMNLKDDYVATQPEKPATYSIFHAYDFMLITDPAGILIILGFTWPVIILALGKLIKKWKASVFFPVLEILLCAGSAFIVFSLGNIGQFMYGAYIAFAALALYLYATFADIWILINSKMKKTNI